MSQQENHRHHDHPNANAWAVHENAGTQSVLIEWGENE
jgi:hypothetical protein